MMRTEGAGVTDILCSVISFTSVKGVGGGVFYIPNSGFSAHLPGSSQADPHIQHHNPILQALQQQAFSSIMTRN